MNHENSKMQESFSSGKKVLVAILSIVSSLIFFGLGQVIPHFKTTFENFGAEVPTLTNLVVSLSNIYFSLALISLIPIVSLLISSQISFNLKNLIFKATIVFCVFAIFYFMLSLVAIYLPVLELSKTKG
jgi:type II secretory pathway component PulF